MAAKKHLTVTQAADRVKRKRWKILRAIKKGHLKAIRIGWVYVIAEEDLLDYAKAHK